MVKHKMIIKDFILFYPKINFTPFLPLSLYYSPPSSPSPFIYVIKDAYISPLQI